MLKDNLGRLSLYAKDSVGLNNAEIAQAVCESLAPIKASLKRVLLVPPDYTRFHSNAGYITQVIYHDLKDTCTVDIMPALGTHLAVSPREWEIMFGSVPYERMIEHRWRQDICRIGEVPGAYVSSVSEGIVQTPVPVEINRRLLDSSYDLILSIGQVVPHEVIGIANHSKNIFVGCGGPAVINATHMLGAVFGMERVMGKDHSPVRRVLDYAAEHFTQDIPLSYILTVTDAPGGDIRTHGLFIGHERSFFEEAVKLTQKKNMTVLSKAVKKAVVYLDELEFKSTWVGNKAIYRTRMAIADGGELVILAPGVDKFGEDKAVDALIRKYGYRGRDYVLQTLKSADDLLQNLSAAAHLIHGSNDGRFTITYCTRHLSRQEVEDVGFGWLPYDEAVARYPREEMVEGWNTLSSGEEVYYVPNPALGLWMHEARMN